MGRIVGYAIVAALNPALLAATTIMLLLERPKGLMVGYWLGAMFTAVTLGLVIVFALKGSGFEHSSKKRPTRRSSSPWRGYCWSPFWCSPPASTSPSQSGGQNKILPIVFVVIFGTVVVYGLSGRPVAQRLGVAAEKGP